MHPALEKFLREFEQVSPAIVDAYFVVDSERNIVEFNRAFYASLPRQLARGLRGKKCYDVIELNICQSRCIAESCWRQGRHVRLDEISGRPAGEPESEERRFILSAIPIADETGKPVGAVEIRRNVTNEAAMQKKYREMLETGAAEREHLLEQIRDRTSELLEANRRLLETQKELLDYKRGIK